MSGFKIFRLIFHSSLCVLFAHSERDNKKKIIFMIILYYYEVIESLLTIFFKKEKNPYAPHNVVNITH